MSKIFLGVIAWILTVILLIQWSMPIQPQRTATEVVTSNQIDPELIRASNAVVMIGLDKYENGGSGILIGRIRVDEDTWKYRILTAHHVMEDLLDALKAATTPEEKIDIKRLSIAHRKSFQDKIHVWKVQLQDIDWSIPAQDWLIFNCDIDAEFECATLGTRADFEAIKAYEDVYGVGCDDLRGIFMRDGFISSVDCIQPFFRASGNKAWSIFPNLFFRPFHTVSRGVSGGGIFSKDGLLIGMYNAVGLDDTGEEINGMAIALKLFIVQESLLVANSSITLIEK